MPKYYCDYCDTFLTHDSPSVRKTHCNGKKHKENVKVYYQNWLKEQAQKLIESTTAAFKANKALTPTGLPFVVPGMMKPMMGGIPPSQGPMPMPGFMPPGIIHPPGGACFPQVGVAAPNPYALPGTMPMMVPSIPQPPPPPPPPGSVLGPMPLVASMTGQMIPGQMMPIPTMPGQVMPAPGIPMQAMSMPAMPMTMTGPSPSMAPFQP